MITDAFSGNEGPVADMIAMNAGAAIYLSGIVSSIKEGISIAKEILASKSAMNVLEDYIKLSNS